MSPIRDLIRMILVLLITALGYVAASAKPRDAYLDVLAACGADTECLDATNQIYWLVSAENTQRMALCGSNAECLQEHYDAMLAVRADAELYAKAQALSGNIGAEIRALEHADARHVVNPGGQWGTNYASYALRACGGQTSTGCFAAYYDDMKSNWLLSGGSDAMFGFAISAGIAVTPSTIAALRTCAATPYCMTGLATELAAGTLGEVQGVMMMTAAVGGSSRLVLQHGDKIVGVMDDFGNILKATDQSFLGRILFETPQGGVAYFDDAGRLVRGQIDETGGFVATNRTFDFADDADGFIDDIVDFNRGTDGGGTLLNGDMRSIVQSASYYDTPAEQDAAIFRSIISNHTFVNGNKRTAVAAYQNFASRTGLPTNLSDNAMLDIATRVATGELSDVSAIANALR